MKTNPIHLTPPYPAIPCPGHSPVTNCPSPQRAWGLMGHDAIGSSWFRRPVATEQDSLHSHRHLADSPGGSRLWDVIYFQYLVFYFPFPTMTNSPPLAQRILI